MRALTTPHIAVFFDQAIQRVAQTDHLLIVARAEEIMVQAIVGANTVGDNVNGGKEQATLGIFLDGHFKTATTVVGNGGGKARGELLGPADHSCRSARSASVSCGR